ncbi:peptidase [Leifsonia shinshuensis]|uniref:Peptidase n=1 Tax=Leifsonia shinshuensis TaxID=150026 RepID=A0A7G6Y8B9_9MICO|nr:peptidase [Leifsonia shinshuensis]QNE34734.1 peptidase [Leifsonia shinshuensis]
MSAVLQFLTVFAASLIGACVVVGFYALGTRLLAVAGRALFVEPAEFTDAITVITPEEAAKAQKKAEKARRKSPLSEGRKRAALAAAYACFVLCGVAVLYGLYLIIPYFHG